MEQWRRTGVQALIFIRRGKNKAGGHFFSSGDQLSGNFDPLD
jgi:hypothetical protein